MWDLIAKCLEGIPTQNPYFLELDKAVMEKFEGIECKTFEMVGIDIQTVTQFRRSGGGLLPEKQAWQVRKFIADWKRKKADEVNA